MKISASIYSTQEKDLTKTIAELDKHKIDLFHIDCNDDLSIFDDITAIRKISRTPLDIHIISAKPEKFYPYLEKFQPEYVTFQYENLKNEIRVPKTIKSNLGLAISSDTPTKAFEKYADTFSFILIMATTPGKSGGAFNKENFAKIRQFRKAFPDKNIHVDGGVNAEVSFILRNMGVDVAVSGSFLMKAETMGAALVDLKTNEIHSHYKVSDFMYGLNEIPVLGPEHRNIKDVLLSVENGKMGFTLLVDKNDCLEGLISNADVRRGLIKNLNDLNKFKIADTINANPVKAQNEQTVAELLTFIKKQNFPITYMPVVDKNNKLTGAITFINLIKGEL